MIALAWIAAWLLIGYATMTVIIALEAKDRGDSKAVSWLYILMIFGPIITLILLIYGLGKLRCNIHLNIWHKISRIMLKPVQILNPEVKSWD